jgi:glycosyltransferase involved in cell wall biosynthesis
MEQVAFRLMDRLTASRFSFHIATPRPFGPGVGRVRAIDPQARDFPYRGRFGWRDFPALRAHVRDMSKTCSHIWVTGTSAAALAAIKGLRQPKLLSHHYHHFENVLSYPRWRAFYEVLCRDLDAITYPTRMTRDEAVRIAPWLASKAYVVPNGIEVHYTDEASRRDRRLAARQKLGLPESAFVVGNAGWLVRRKRFDVFLRTAARVYEHIPESRFVICGGGEEEGRLKQLAIDLGLEEVVRFVGWTGDLQEHYRSWDALLFNTDFDTLPSTPMEAAAEGCVVVASQAYGGLGEFIEHDRTGCLFATHNIDELARTLVELHISPTHAERLRRQAAIKLKSEFSLDGMAAFYADFFSKDTRTLSASNR